MLDSELELIRRAKSEDRAAMAELLNAHAEQSYGLALHILRNEADAEDATQNALIRAFTNLGRFQEGRPFSPWLLRIVSREALRVLRAERTRFAFWHHQARDEESGTTVESIVQVRAEHRELWRAVNRLKSDDLTVLTLSYFMGMSDIEVAETLGVKKGAAKKRKHSAIKRLRALVEREFPELGDDAIRHTAPEGTAR